MQLTVKTRAVNIAIKYCSIWYCRYFIYVCHYRTTYRDSFILLVSHEYRRSFLVM